MARIINWSENITEWGILRMAAIGENLKINSDRLWDSLMEMIHFFVMNVAFMKHFLPTYEVVRIEIVQGMNVQVIMIVEFSFNKKEASLLFLPEV